MTEPQGSKAKLASGSKAAAGRLFVPDIGGGIIFTVNPDGSDRKDIVTGCRTPDGVVVDVEAGIQLSIRSARANPSGRRVKAAVNTGDNLTA